VTTRKDNAQGEEFGVEFKVRYTGNYFLVDEHRERELPLLSRSQHAIYVRPKDSESYRLAVQLSTVTMREIRTVFNIDTLTCKDFFAFNVEDLTKIASSGEAPIKEWLARYAQQCESLPERARLLNLLAR
jgi:hypothetical protein